MEFLINNKNFNIVKTENRIECYSYEKMIGVFILDQCDLFVFDAKITTITNQKHLQQFKRFLSEHF